MPSPDEQPTDVIPDAPFPGPVNNGPVNNGPVGDGPVGNGPAGNGSPKVTVTRVAVARSRQLTAAAAARVRAASRADGAGESGLTQLLWVNALHMAGDAMIAVSLAGTLFFAASTDAQRGNVALYLLVTMAPFAVLAPVIGPALDRLQRGRRWAMAVSHLGRAVLALVMMSHFDDFWLYPAALGVLVLSKAHNVLRAAVVPRVLPSAMSLTSANARLSVFGLATAGVAGAIGAGIAAVLGFDWELGATSLVFLAAGVLAVRLPRHVDVPTGELQADVFTTAEIPVGRGRRRRVSPHVVLALRANTALRGLGGFLTIFSAFLVQATFDGGWEATLALGAIAAAAGVGSFAGTAAGSRLHAAEPDRLVLISAASAAAITVLAAVFYSFAMAAVVAARGGGDERAGQGVARRDHPARGPREPAGLGVRAVGDDAAAGLGGRRRLRDRAPADRLAGLHRGRGAARPRGGADRVEPVPRRRAGVRAARPSRPMPRPTPVGQQWS